MKWNDDSCSGRSAAIVACVRRSLSLAWRLLPVLAVLASSAGVARAHLASDSYLRLDVTAPHRIEAQWDIALRDLDVAVGLDADADGTITWGELKAKRREIEEYALGHLGLRGSSGACTPTPSELLVDNHAGSAYAVLRFTADCGELAGPLTLTYRLLFEIDATHRGLLTIIARDGVRTEVLSPDHAVVAIDLAPRSRLAETRRFFLFGFDHILHGYDHLLFIAVLLVMASLRRSGRSGWVPVESLGRALIESVKILTAFTVAHGTTLTLAVLGIVEIPSRVVEPAVAVTIMLTASDNIRPILPQARWTIAFAFGLVHGLAFASAFEPMQLQPLDLALALGCFNLGIEAGQALLALVVVPAGFALRRVNSYRTVLAPIVSAAALALAGIWFIDRVFVPDWLSIWPIGRVASALGWVL
jgi:hydrogenase/urease accessory protein HupE